MILFHAAALVAFFGALHISELVVQSKADAVKRALQRGDIAWDGSRFYTILPRKNRKTSLKSHKAKR